MTWFYPCPAVKAKWINRKCVSEKRVPEKGSAKGANLIAVRNMRVWIKVLVRFPEQRKKKKKMICNNYFCLNF